MSVLLAAVILAGVAGIPASASVPASASARGWSVTPSPNPVIPTGQLFWVSCPAANSCMAVGTYTKASGAGVTLAEQWNGSKWRIQPIPSPPGAAWSNLFGVSCVSPSACEAVGTTASRSGAQKVLAERWNGSRWQLQHAPSPAGGGQLNGVSCTSRSACTAVGASPQGTPRKVLAERWNGRSWKIQPTPSPAGAFLSGVACTSSSGCTAVGGSNAGTLAERWDGTTWSTQATPNPPQGGGALFSVACTSPSACTAVGTSNAGNLAERWNGTSWSIKPTPNPAGAQFPFLNTVACASASACIAAGAYINSSGAVQALAERWNGTNWAIQPTPRLPGGAMSQLIGVACTSATGCLAVGLSNPNFFNNQSPATLAERWNGSTWRVQHTPNPPGAAAGNLNAASCVSRSACIAVGNTSNRRGNSLTLAQRWNGHSWSIQPTPSPADGGNLTGVSCPSRSSCLAVGGHRNPFIEIPPGTLAERWNGTRWRIQPTPNPPGGGWFLTAVSCTSPSACTAVGGRLAPTMRTGLATLAERWNGHTWSIQPTPNPPGHGVKLLNSVACTSRSSCMAVGNEFDPATGESLGTLAERWNGRTWRIVPTFKPAPAGPNAGLNSVACTSASACTAVGNRTLVKTLAERWNGRTWHVQATPNPSGGQNITLAGVACPARTVCTAFGLNLTGSGPLTLAERWSGGRWRIQPTPGLVAYDIGFPGVACPTPSACYAVASYANNGSSVTLAERWNRTGTSTQAATRRPVASGALPSACIRARMPGSLSISGRIPAAAWSRFRVGSFLSRAASPSPASRIWCGAG
ncbi:MAG TPA: hypothetical protein VKD66_11195 [Streptosporangiaceae bacterium]|nr:hypothetical protein [Streptosporangiaceae bacterium]